MQASAHPDASIDDLKDGFGGGGDLSFRKPLLVRLDKLYAAHLPTNYDRWLESDDPYEIS